MARLQILELPEGDDDSRPPFVLVVDETVPQRVIIGVDHGAVPDYWQRVAAEIGARGVIVTPETVEIPANDVSAEFREGLQQSLAELYESARRSLSESETLGHKLLQRAERAEAERVAADNMLRAVCEVFGGPHQDPVVKARETLARAKAAEEKLAALGKQDTERMDQVTDALGLDRLRDWDEIVSAIKRQRQIDVDGGHRFVAVPERDGGLCCSVCGVTRDLWADLPGTPTCAAIKERGYF
jgi:phosphoglycolate phosphatase-like HAD superfamily hydrolase